MTTKSTNLYGLISTGAPTAPVQRAQAIEQAARAVIAARNVCQDDDIIRNLEPELAALSAALAIPTNRGN